MIITDQILDLINAGALFVCNHSGGKDSQAMYIQLSRLVPKEQLVVIHAELDGVEWDGTLQHVKDTVTHPLYTVAAKKTFFEMVDARGMFPSPKYRQCTSDLKRDPINKQVRQLLKHRDCKIVVNCMGLRAGESCNRAAKEVLTLSARNSKAGRTWYEFLPIHNYTEEQVFSTIELAGQKPHWAYSVGMSRLSCCFCIMSSKEDLKIAAKYNPLVLAQIDKLERKHNYKMMMPKKGEEAKFLVDIIAE